MSAPIRNSLGDFLSENFEAFASFDSAFDSTIVRVGRELDPSFHDFVLQQLVEVFVGGLSSGRTIKSRLVIDSNIVVGDCFRVATGKPSSTERLFKSPFIELWAPDSIEAEVAESIRDDLPRGASREKAIEQATRLIGALRLCPVNQLVSVRRAQQLLDAYDPDDVPFLALAFDLNAEAIVSRDTASIGQQREIPRWDIGGIAQVAGIMEGGSLSLVIVGATASATLNAVESVFLVVAAAFQSALILMAAIVGAAAEGLASVLAQIPPRILQAIGILALIALVGVVLGLIFSPEFRESVASGLEKVASAMAKFAGMVVELAKRIVGAIYAVFVWVWNVMLPLTAISVTAAGVIFRRIGLLLARVRG